MIDKKNKVVQLLIQRDNLSEDKAIAKAKKISNKIMIALEEGGDPDEIVANELNLHPDYMWELVV